MISEKLKNMIDINEIYFDLRFKIYNLITYKGILFIIIIFQNFVKLNILFLKLGFISL